LGCCGINAYTDWNGTAYFKENGIPTSCCKIKYCSPESLKDLEQAATEVYEQVRIECGSTPRKVWFSVGVGELNRGLIRKWVLRV
jgi:hypothetical protein